MGDNQGLYELNEQNAEEEDIWHTYQTSVEIFIALR